MGQKIYILPTNRNYDVVNACLLDLDKRIWAGIVASVILPQSINAFLPIIMKPPIQKKN